MKYLLFLFVAFSGLTATAQNATVALEAKPHPPQERYQIMKSGSQTFQDYKVIKEFILDGVWKITLDSLTKRENQLVAANAKIASLQKDVLISKSDLKSKEDSMTDVVFASTHITVFGRGLSKTSFLLMVFGGLAGLLLVIVLLFIRLKAMQYFVSESKVMVGSISNELDEFKRNALAKEIKLSRELQTERNRVLELKKV